MDRTVVSVILSVCWLVFAGYWIISAVGVKRDVKRSGSYGLTVIVRLISIAVIVYVLNLPQLRPTMANVAAVTDHPSIALEVIGVALTVFGVAFCIWARVHIGRNWSPVPALKEEHELITTGPYRIVRNPIYSGILFAMLGSALAAGLIYGIIFAVCLVSFVYRVFAEDRLMMQQFPNTYPAYRRKTKALIPFVV